MKTALVLTTIQSAEQPAIIAFSEGCKKNDWQFVVAGDVKSPSNFKLGYGEYLSVEQQGSMQYSLAGILPYHHYSRKNIAYLRAIQNGAEVIVESDDDNLPSDEFWSEKNNLVSGRLVGGSKWINAYHYFGKNDLWPRGFSLQHLDQAEPRDYKQVVNMHSPIQQMLADGDPDIDAIQRLHSSTPHFFEKAPALLLGEGSICPFNSQSTVWFSEVFALLYLPSTCSFRMCDIWRSFVAQRVLAETEGCLSFHSASVEQLRNEHDLMKDLEQETEGYVYNAQLVDNLDQLKLEQGWAAIENNMLQCYTLLVEKNYLEATELELLAAWLQDLKACRKGKD